jgi:hypothetical protein
MCLAAAAELAMGRRPWGIQGRAGLWSGDIWSEHNSQFVADPYTFTHISHGVLFYGLTWLAFRGAPLTTRLLITIALESAWEVLENTDAVINRYRTATISLDYYGDSIVNSMSDIVACMCGFFLAFRLPKRVTVAGFIVVEVLLALWIRDNLTINIVMLLAPIRAIQNWQLAK